MELPNNYKEEVLNKLKVYKPQTLFEIDIDVARVHGKCPYCFNKLKYLRSGKLAGCWSKKHGKPFIIKVEKLFKKNV